jgi:hypothetical protein
MLQGTIELLGGLFLGDLSSIALTLLIAFCIVGSIVATLRAVSSGSTTLSTRREKSVVSQFQKHLSPAAKAAVDLVALTARLKPRPFKTNSN